MIIQAGYRSRRDRKAARRRGRSLLLLLMGLMLIAGAYYAFMTHGQRLGGAASQEPAAAQQPPPSAHVAIPPAVQPSEPSRPDPAQPQQSAPIAATPVAPGPATQVLESSSPALSPQQPSASLAPVPRVVPAQATPSPAPLPAPRPPLEALNLAVVTENNIRYATGVIRNNTATNYVFAQAEIDLFDQSGFRIGTIMVNTIRSGQKLEAFGEWHFRAMLMDPRVNAFKVVSLSGQ